MYFHSKILFSANYIMLIPCLCYPLFCLRQHLLSFSWKTDISVNSLVKSPWNSGVNIYLFIYNIVSENYVRICYWISNVMDSSVDDEQSTMEFKLFFYISIRSWKIILCRFLSTLKDKQLGVQNAYMKHILSVRKQPIQIMAFSITFDILRLSRCLYLSFSNMKINFLKWYFK